MNADWLKMYSTIWCVDFEFSAPDGENPIVVCMVARDLHSGRLIRVWADELAALTSPPFSIGPDSLFVAYYVPAELNCFLSLGWMMPARILDPFVEFRNKTNGLPVICGSGLLGAMAWHGLDSIDVSEKELMRALAMRGGDYTPQEKKDLLDYCQTDVDALIELLPKMAYLIDLPRALIRGRYTAAVAKMETCGTPIDTKTLRRFRANWAAIKGRLIEKIDADYGVYVPTGQKVINRKTNLGQQILFEADRAEVSPEDLSSAVDQVWHEERQINRDRRQAIEAARKATGLTIKQIEKWEDAGRDYSTWPGLDVEARELASEYPELGIGEGYNDQTSYDDTDHAALLWELLGEWPDEFYQN